MLFTTSRTTSPVTMQLFEFHDITKNQAYPKLCKDCKHFRRDETFVDDLKYGRCIKKIKVNLVDGSHIVPYAEIVRTFDCKGKWWEDDNEFMKRPSGVGNRT